MVVIEGICLLFLITLSHASNLDVYADNSIYLSPGNVLNFSQSVMLDFRIKIEPAYGETYTHLIGIGSPQEKTEFHFSYKTKISKAIFDISCKNHAVIYAYLRRSNQYINVDGVVTTFRAPSAFRSFVFRFNDEERIDAGGRVTEAGKPMLGDEWILIDDWPPKETGLKAFNTGSCIESAGISINNQNVLFIFIASMIVHSIL